MENIEEKLNKLLNKIDRLDKEIENLIKEKKKINEKIFKLEKELDKKWVILKICQTKIF